MRGRNHLPWLKARFPLYFENIKAAGVKVQEVTERIGLKDWDVSDYEALPDWKPCESHTWYNGRYNALRCRKAEINRTKTGLSSD